MTKQLQLFVISCFLISAAVCSTLKQQTECCESYCYNTDSDPPHHDVHFNTKTAYEDILDSNSLHGAEDLIENYKPTKIWSIIRDGTRYAGSPEIMKFKLLEERRDEIIKNYEENKGPANGALCAEDLAALKAWKWDESITNETATSLTPQGWKDFEGIARRYRENFPSIFTTSYSADHYRFVYARARRCKESFTAYVNALFGSNALDLIKPTDPTGTITLIEAYDQCPRWSKQNSDNYEADTEIMKLDRSEIYQQMIADVSTKLGFSSPLTESQVEEIFHICRYERAWHLTKSPWCAAFTFEQILLYEYSEDIDYYYRNSYGTELNDKIMCHAMQDMMSHMKASDGPSVISYFTHSAALQLMLNSMNAFKDANHLRADNYAQMGNRLWKLSHLTPYAANLVAVKYESTTMDEDAFKVVFFLNEKQIDFDWCKDGCDWSDVVQQFAQFYDTNCDQMLEESCNNGAFGLQVSIIAILFLGISVSFY